jgi:hypothetical protein
MAAAPPPVPSAGDESKDPKKLSKAVVNKAAAGPGVGKLVAASARGGVPKSGAAGEASLSSLLPPDGGEAGAEGEEHQNRHQPVGFLNQPWVQNILPLATSLGLHIGLITLGILGYQVAKQIANPNKDQVIIPEAKSIDKNAIPGGIPHPGLNNDVTRDAAQDAIKNSTNDGFTDSVSKNAAAALGGGQGDNDPSDSIGPTNNSGKGSSNGGGSGSALGGGDGGGTAPWGVPGGGGGGMLPKSSFMGTNGNANKVIYLCDASGSMLSVFGALKQNLKESIQALQLEAGQQFNVIFFSDDNCIPLFKDGMHIATNDNKKLAMDFVDSAVSTGGTQPLPAIKFALDEKPELLYVLTDGFDQISNYDDVTNAFKKGNPDGKMHINCIFLQSDEDPKLEEFLKAIAVQGHGDFKKILKSDM